MSKTCLNKLTGNILTDCTLPIHGVKELYLMHVQDVTFTLVGDATQVSAVVFAEGAKSYKVEGYKQNLQVTASLRSTDASERFDVSIMFKSKLLGSIGRPIMTGKFYVMVVDPQSTGANIIWGINSPLECSNVEYDSNANGGLVTYTLTAPEGSAGNNFILSYPTVAASIINKSV